MKNFKFLPICRPLLFLLVLGLSTAATAANNNADKKPKAGQTSQEQRDVIEKRRKKYESLSKAEKKKVREAREKYKEMTPEERRKLKEKWKKSQNSGN